MKIHWYDSETSGVKAHEQQMLTFAMVTTDINLNVLSVLDEKIRLRPDITPTKEALSINKIDPYSLEWFATSLEEKDFCEKLSQYLQKNWSEGDIFIAYSAAFDNGFMKEAFKRNKKYFYPDNKIVCFDPLKMVRKAVSSGNVVTVERRTSDGRKYWSSKLEDVAVALKTQHKGPAHNALNDVYTLIKTTPVVYKALTGMTLAKFLTENEYRVQF